MKIIIDIPKDVYKETLRTEIWNEDEKRAIRFAIRNCTILPKGHGRLIDADALIFNADYWEPYISKLDFDNAPTIIEADNEMKGVN